MNNIRKLERQIKEHVDGLIEDLRKVRGDMYGSIERKYKKKLGLL